LRSQLSRLYWNPKITHCQGVEASLFFA
jgi:hypothetical protein